MDISNRLKQENKAINVDRQKATTWDLNAYDFIKLMILGLFYAAKKKTM